MRHRQKLTRGQSKKIFRQGANKMHKKNFPASFAMRGGIKL